MGQKPGEQRRGYKAGYRVLLIAASEEFSLGFCWKDKVTKKQLWEQAEEELIALQVRRRKWIGHTLRKPASNTTRHTLSWNPQGKRKRGRPRKS